MNTWMKLLPLDVGGVTERMLPQGDIDPGDTVVGTLPDELINLYSLWQATAKESQRTLVDVGYARSDEDLIARYDELADKAKALEYLFWIGVKEHFKLWGVGIKETLGIRQEYQIVKQKRSPHPFAGLFGS